MKTAPAFRVLLVFIILSVIGYALLPMLPLQYLPENKSSTIQVSFFLTDAAPDVLEQEVTTPLEASFSLVDGVKKISSQSGFGEGSIRIVLEESASLGLVKYQISNRLRQLYQKLPIGLSYPQLDVVCTGNKEDTQPLLIWSLIGNRPPNELERFALELLTPQLALEQGIDHISVVGGNEMEWKIIFDGNLLNRLDVKKNEVIQAAPSLLDNSTLGAVHDLQYVKNANLLRSINGNPENTKIKLQELEIANRGGRIIKLKDFAVVKYVEKRESSFYRINGVSGIRILAYLSSEANSIEVSDRMKVKMLNLEKLLPRSLKIQLDYDEAAFINNELQKVKQRTIWSLGLLLLFVLVAYRNIKQLIVLTLGLVATIGLAAIGYYILNVQLHLYALAGITVSLGIIIDNAIVVIHHLRNKKQHSVMPALMASTLTTLAALVVLWRLPKEWKMNLLAFGQVIFINLIASLVVAWWLMPALLQSFKLLEITQNRKERLNWKFRRCKTVIVRKYRKFLQFLINNRKWAIAGFILLFGLPVFMLPDKVDGWNCYNKTLGSDWYNEKLRPLVDKSLGGTLRLFSWYVWEGSSWRQPEATQLFIEAKMPQGATVDQLNEVFKNVEAFVGKYRYGVDKFVTNIDGADYGQTIITFKENIQDGVPYILKNKLIAFSLNFGGVKWNIYGIGRGFSNENNNTAPVYQVKLTGYNRDQLKIYASRLPGKLSKHPRVRDIVEDANQDWWERERYVYSINLDKGKMALQGINPLTLVEIIERHNRSNTPDFFLPDGTPVKLVNNSVVESDAWSLMNQAQRVDSMRILFPEIGKIEKSKAPNVIYKEAQQYIQTLKFTYTGSYRFGSKFLNEKLEELEKEMLPGYAAQFMERGWRSDSDRYLVMLLLVVGLIFFICALTFESLRQPFVVILSIPMSFVGIFLTYYWFDFPLDQGGYTSFLMVSGLAVNGLILVLNDYNAIHRKCSSLSEVRIFVKSIRGKFLPIFLSVLSTVLGLVPFTMHGESEVFWFSLAVGTMGGLLFSLVVILFMMPVLLCWQSTTSRSK